MQNKTIYDVCILGGGASGLAAAVEASHAGANTAVVEKLDRVGKKLLATGNGRCNLLNLHASPDDYNDPAFVARVFARYDVQGNLDFFRAMGLLTTADGEGRVYPRTMTASSVLDTLRMTCARQGVCFLCGSPVTSLTREGALFCVNGTLYAHRVIVACGGKASPAQGSDGSGYALLRTFGHRCTELRPALVQIRTAPAFVRSLKGVRAPAALTLHTTDGGNTALGEVLFTDYGLSGIAAMDLSRGAREGTQISIDFLAECSHETVLDLLAAARSRNADAPAEQLLTGLVHNRIALALLHSTLRDSLPASCGAFSDAQLRTLADALKGYTLPVLGVKGFADAQVTAGGVEVDGFSDTLESRLVPGLYAAGEILNIDGKCGGYNLTFAWSSGRLAGYTAAQTERSSC